MATYYRNDLFVKSVLGAAVSGAQVFWCTQPANVATDPPSPLASVFSDSLGQDPVSQPIITDGQGHADAYMLAGFYTVVIVNQGQIVAVYPDQAIGAASGGVATLNGVSGALSVQGGVGISVSVSGSNIIVSSVTTPVTSLNTLTGDLAITAGSGITVTPSGSDIQIAASASGGSPNGSNIFAIPQPNGANGGLGGYTLIIKIPAAQVLAVGTVVSLTVMTGTTVGGLVVDNTTLGATLPGLVTGALGGGYTNPVAWTTPPTTVTWPGGSFAAATTRYTSNPCTFTVDTQHDYYIMIYLDGTTTGSVPYFNTAGISQYTYMGGYLSGDHTEDSDSSSVQTPSGNGFNLVVGFNIA